MEDEKPGEAHFFGYLFCEATRWLFAGSERAGKRAAAAIQSLLGMAKLNGLDPHAWLKDTLEKLPAWPNNRIDELLPLKAALP